jgi:hypothetical protein
MQGEGKPKSQTEKCEVCRFPGAGALDGLPTAILSWQFLLNGCQKRESLFSVLLE